VLLSGSAFHTSATSVAGTSFFSAFAASFLLILGSEIGDKTFFIAAILSMKNSYLVVFSGAIGALVVMTILSAGLGLLLPGLLSKELTHYACVGLFFFFGVRLLYDVYTSEPDGGENEELKEVEMELANADTDLESTKAGDRSPSRADTVDDMKRKVVSWWTASESRRVFVQAFIMTFLAEWGDRSQIATIALASARDPVGVTLGGIVGHCLCTGVAVLGGKFLASRIHERQVNLVGGMLFLLFAFVSLIMGVE
jgi:putative Ca2+/H+ antiporter (TMEM165/GDT1 family)